MLVSVIGQAPVKQRLSTGLNPGENGQDWSTAGPGPVWPEYWSRTGPVS